MTCKHVALMGILKGLPTMPLPIRPIGAYTDREWDIFAAGYMAAKLNICGTVSIMIEADLIADQTGEMPDLQWVTDRAAELGIISNEERN